MKFKKLFLTIVIITFITMLSGAMVYAGGGCTTVLVTPGASADASSMCSYTYDCGTCTFHITRVAEADHEPGTMRPILKNIENGPYLQKTDPVYSVGEIPEVSHSYAYNNSSYSYQNEMQVAMGESTISGRRELRNKDGWFDLYELPHVAIERSATAREFIKTMGTLAEKYGYSSGAEHFSVIDPNETWSFEIYGPGPLWKPGSERLGCAWVAQRVPDGEISFYCNRSRIGAINLDDPDHFMASENIYSLAEEMGWWSKDSDKEFKVYETYGYKPYSLYNARREWRILNLLAPSLNLDPNLERYPFSVKPDKPVTVQEVMRINRDQYQGTEYDLTKGLAAGPFGCPNRYPTSRSQNPEGSSGWERAISMFRTVYCVVNVARKGMPDWIGGISWIGLDAPHTTCFFPIYGGVTELPESLAKGMRGGSYDVFSRESAWWAFNFVSNWADLKFSYMIEDIKAVRDPFEAEFFAIQPVIEKAATELYEQDPALARTFLTTYTNSCVTRVVDAYWKLASQLVGRYADGYVYGDETFKRDTVGYPEWWLEAVDFGKSTIPPEGGPKK